MFATFQFEDPSVPGARKRGVCTKCYLDKRKAGFNIVLMPCVSDHDCSASRKNQRVANARSKAYHANSNSLDLGGASLSCAKSAQIKGRDFQDVF